MSYTNTVFLALKKAVKGSNQPFETDVFNSNWDAVDAGVSALDGRLDAVEANSWVTSARIADNAVGSSEIAAGAVGESELADNAVTNVKLADAAVDTAELKDGAVTAGKLAAVLDLSGKTVSVAVPTSNLHAATKKYVDDAMVSQAAWVSYSPVLSSGANASASGFFVQVGKTVVVRVQVTFDAQPSAPLTVSLPVVARSGVTSMLFSGLAKGSYPLFGTLSTGGGPTVSTVALKVMATNGSYGSLSAVNANVPAAWVADESLYFSVVYEAV